MIDKSLNSRNNGSSHFGYKEFVFILCEKLLRSFFYPFLNNIFRHIFPNYKIYVHITDIDIIRSLNKVPNFINTHIYLYTHICLSGVIDIDTQMTRKVKQNVSLRLPFIWIHFVMLLICDDHVIHVVECTKFTKNGFTLYNFVNNIVGMWKKAFSDNVLSRASIFGWYKLFTKGIERVEDDKRLGRPSTSTGKNHVNHTQDFVLKNHHLSIRDLVNITNLSFGSIQSILEVQLGLRRISSRLVPRTLNLFEKDGYVSLYETMISDYQGAVIRLI